MSIWSYILKRILQGIPIIIIVSFISFFLIRLSPVDPLAELRMNPSITKKNKKKKKTKKIIQKKDNKKKKIKKKK